MCKKIEQSSSAAIAKEDGIFFKIIFNPYHQSCLVCERHHLLLY